MANYSILIILCCSTTPFAQEDATLQRGCVKATSSSSTCNIQFQKSKLKEVLRLQREPTNNIVNIRTFVISRNKTRYFPGIMTWASEIGRTIKTLVQYAENRKVFASPMFTWILKVGTEEVDIKLNASDGCLPPGNNGTKKIFNSLLRELFSHSADPHFYKLCRSQDDGRTPLSCCQIIGDENLKICSNYSSVVVKLARPAVILIFCISSLFVLPFVLEYIVRYPSNDEPRFYKTSESHMSLTSVFSMILFEGRGPVKSFFRRSVLAGLSLLVFLPTGFFGSYFLLVTFWTWFAVFLVTYDVRMTNDKCKEKCDESCKSRNEKGCLRTQWGKDLVSCFTTPFFRVFFDWKKWFQQRCQNYELFRRLSNEDLGGFKIFCCRLFQFIYGLGGCIFIAFSAAFYLLFVLFGLIKFTMADLMVSFVLPHPFHCSPCSCNSVDSGLFCFIKTCETVPKNIWSFFVRLATLLNIGFLIGMILMFALFTVVGLSLNAEYFNPFLASTLALILFFWKNWKFSVEGRCLQLKISIIEICKEKAPSTEDEQTVNGGPRSEPDNSNLFCDLYFGRRNGCDCYGQAAGRVPARGPTIRTIEPTTGTSLKVTWKQLINDSNARVRKYKIYYNIGSKVTYCSTNKTVTGSDTTTTYLSGLKPATEYTVAVRAFNHLGGGPLGDRVRGKTRNVPARGPAITTIAATEDTSLKVTWEKLTNDVSNGEVTKYKIYYKKLSSTVPLDRSTRETVTADVNTTTVDLTGLQPATEYTVAVQAFNRIGGGPLGAFKNKKTKKCEDPNNGAQRNNAEIPNKVPARGPTITTIEATTDTSLRISWDELNGNESNGEVTGYEIYYDIGSTVSHIFSNSKTVTGSDTTTANLTGLQPGTEYTVAAQAFNRLGGGALGASRNGKTPMSTNNDEENEQGNNVEPQNEVASNEEENEQRNDVAIQIEELIIKFDDHGETMIQKTLYDDISKEVLPLDHLLVFFCRRVIFVSVYAFALFIAMILARDSGVSEGIQAVSAIAGALIPLFLDSILADHHAVEMDANNMAMKEKLSRMLTAKRLGNNTIVVELIDIKKKRENQDRNGQQEASV